MLKYLVVLTADNAVSYCHYEASDSPKLIDYDDFAKALRWSMCENINVQYVLPDEMLPARYEELMESVDNVKICSFKSEYKDVADVVVFKDLSSAEGFEFTSGTVYAIHTDLNDLEKNISILDNILSKADRINLVISETEVKSLDNQKRYSKLLDRISDSIVSEFCNNHAVQVNLLTDRLMLTEMNNCSAGWESVALAPDGCYYECPAFYYDNSTTVGSVSEGVSIKNQQLYSLGHSPICRSCDAWHCRRCVWKNKKKTLEVNTPGHNQCVMSHLERNASARLLRRLREKIPTLSLPEYELAETPVLDPFEKVVKNFF